MDATVKKITSFTLSACLALSVTNQAFAQNETFDKYADVGAIAIPVVAGIITLTKNDDKGLWQLGESYALTMGASYGLKHVVDETRPDGGPHSFPSGHASSAFAGASYLQFRYGWEYGIPAYIAASAVAWSRVDNKHHHWKDVLASAAIANVSAYFLTDRFEQKVAVLPIIDPQDKSYGLMAAVRF